MGSCRASDFGADYDQVLEESGFWSIGAQIPAFDAKVDHETMRTILASVLPMPR